MKMQKMLVLILTFFFICFSSYGRRYTQKDVDSWYPNRKMLRMYKKNNNLYFFHYGLFYCTSMSIGNNEVELCKFYCNKLVKKEKKSMNLVPLTCDDIEHVLKPFLQNHYEGECMTIDGDAFSYKLKTKIQTCEDMIPVDIDCFISSIKDEYLLKILSLLKGF